MVLYVLHIRIFSHMEGMNTVVAALAAAVIVYSAACYDYDVCPVLYIKIIIYYILHARFGHDNRNMDLFLLSFSADININAGLIFLFFNPDMAAVSVADCHTVQAQIIGAFLLKSQRIYYL